MNLSRLFTVQLSMFSVVFSNSDMLSHLQVFVNNFFIFLFQFFRTDVLSFCDSLIILSNRQPFVNNFFILSGGVFSSLVCDSLYILANLFLFVNRFFHSFYLFFSDCALFLYHESAIHDRNLHMLRMAVLFYHVVFAVYFSFADSFSCKTIECTLRRHIAIESGHICQALSGMLQPHWRKYSSVAASFSYTFRFTSISTSCHL